jgi:hypothetical protein
MSTQDQILLLLLTPLLLAHLLASVHAYVHVCLLLTHKSSSCCLGCSRLQRCCCLTGLRSEMHMSACCCYCCCCCCCCLQRCCCLTCLRP